MLLRVSHVWSCVSVCDTDDDRDDSTPALLMAYVCESAFVMHPSDLYLYLPRCAVGVE